MLLSSVSLFEMCDAQKNACRRIANFSRVPNAILVKSKINKNPIESMNSLESFEWWCMAMMKFIRRIHKFAYDVTSYTHRIDGKVHILGLRSPRICVNSNLHFFRRIATSSTKLSNVTNAWRYSASIVKHLHSLERWCVYIETTSLKQSVIWYSWTVNQEFLLLLHPSKG